MGPQKGRWGTTLQYLGFLCSCLASSSLADLQGLSPGCTPGLPRLLLVTTLQVSPGPAQSISPFLPRQRCPGGVPQLLHPRSV